MCEGSEAYYIIRAYPSVQALQESQEAYYSSHEWRQGPCAPSRSQARTSRLPMRGRLSGSARHVASKNTSIGRSKPLTW